MKKTLILTFIFSLLFLAGCQKKTEQLEQNDSKSDQTSNTNLNTNTNNSKKTNTSNAMPTQFKTKIKISENTTATLKTNLGDIKVKFYYQDSPDTVANFIKLAEEGFYDGVKFHRVIKDFMIQTGDPNSKDDTKKAMWGTGGPGYAFNDEFNDHKLVSGSLAMANSGSNTNGSQFFIVTAESTPWLDGKHTNFGEVVEGLEVVEKIDGVETGTRDVPVEAVIIESVVIE